MGTPHDWPDFGRGTLLAVHAHPDDETLWTGGLLRAWSQAGGHAVVATATRGERGETIGDELAHLEGDGPALAAHRVGELADALRALRVDEHWFLDDFSQDSSRWADSGMAWLGAQGGTAGSPQRIPADSFMAAGRPELERALRQLMDRVRPRVVVTYGPDGGYGHPDHVRVHELTMAVAAQSPGVEYILWRIAGAGTAVKVAANAQDEFSRALTRRWSELESEADKRTGHRRAVYPPLIPAQARPSQVEPSQIEPISVAANETVAVRTALVGTEPDLAVTAQVASGQRPGVLQVALAPVLNDVIAALCAHRSQVQFIRQMPDRPSPMVGVTDQAIAGDIVPGGVTEDQRASDGAPDGVVADEAIAATYALSNGVLQGLPTFEAYQTVSCCASATSGTVI